MIFRLRSPKESLYDLTPIPTATLLQHAGLGVQLAYYAHAFTAAREERYPRELFNWDTLDFDSAPTPVLVYEYMYNQIDEARIARSRVHFGIQVAQQLGSVSKNISGVRVIGAESKLAYRSTERGINDLDMIIDLRKRLTQKEIEKVLRIKTTAEHCTNIPVDLLCPGIPPTAANMEHLGAFFDEPLQHRGWPVYWKNDAYLAQLQAAKIDYFERELPSALRFAEQLRHTKDQALILQNP